MAEPDTDHLREWAASGELREWAASGAMALTGRRDGPPIAAPGSAATMTTAALRDVAETTVQRTGRAPALPGAQILGERAAIAGLQRAGPLSCGGAFRVLATSDGWLGLSLPRPSDLELIPALIESDVPPDVWVAVSAWAASTTTRAAAERVALLGMAGGAVPDPHRTDRAGVLVSEYGPRRHRRERPRVVDLTALWAGPLCAHLLDLGGAEIIKVESTRRPDGARFGPARFFDLLHGGHDMVALDFHDPQAIDALRELLADADLVLESSRPRALAQLGIEATEIVAAGTSWLSITARGRDDDGVGFGDDVAAAAGFVVADGTDLLPCGDALADPLAGVRAAASASTALLAERACLIDVSMLHVAAEAAAGPPAEEHCVHFHDDTWWVHTSGGRFPVHDPVARTPRVAAAALGAANARWLGRQ
ncbi:CoA transferase [Aldersonia sp. NBC_00410]|uniref:CoA transferase n=1 Tax=Aldersonia sp. NBC_00410 TaxID=2975954 RepID=UPI0022540F1E|nr:CoA transferase [Aldersonia sp. NBC_00410]MCX5044179.1 CoA transferase [Aldersonia sp. NBC_00410]